MRRRDFIAGIAGSAAVWPLAANAQQAERTRRIGMLRAAPPPTRELDAFRRALADNGYTEGRNHVLVPAWGDGDIKRIPELAATLAASGVDIVVAEGTITVRAMHALSTKIPIVMARAADPLFGGLVPSLARPGGNITGFSTQAVDITSKLVAILHELVPDFRRVAMVGSRAIWPLFGEGQDKAASAFGIESIYIDLPTPTAIGTALKEAISRDVSGVIVRGTPFFSTANRTTIVEAAASHRMPAIYESRDYVEAGGLAAYATDGIELYRQVAAYVARILNGERAGDLPIQQPTKFELVINLGAAKALGLTVPPRLLFTADEVIE